MMMRGHLLALPILGLAFLCNHCVAPRMLMPFPQPLATTTPRPKVPATYWVTFSTLIRPGMRLPVSVHLAKVGAGAQVTVTLTNNSDHSVVFSQVAAVSVVGAAKSQIINLEIPRDLKRPHWRHWFQYAVNVVATGDVSFNQSKVVTLREKPFSVFVQTDKAIYKPGQTVKIRALAMKPDLTVMQETMDILIRDPLGNGIKRWTKLQGVSSTGVVETSLPTSTDPPLGEWEMVVTVRGQTETHKFTIDEYVLPKFEVTLDVPEVFVISDAGIRGKALAKYSFGKPLNEGEATVTVRASHFWSRNKNETQPFLSRSGKLSKNGELEFLFSKSQLEDLLRRNNHYTRDQKVYLNWQQVKFYAEVMDTRTGKKMKTESQVRFRQDPVKVEFIPPTSSIYKPGHRYSAYVQVTKADGAPIPNPSTVTVNFTVTIDVPGKTGETLFTQLQQLADNGFLSIHVDVPARAERVRVLAETKGVSSQRTASKSASGSGNYLQITTSQQSPQVGQTAKLSIKSTEPVSDGVIYQVYTKGVMVSESKATATDPGRQKFTASFPVTAKMEPNCRVLAFYVRPDGEVVADSVTFKVDASPADQVEVNYARQKVKPGDDVQMTVTARPHSVVFLLTVDKSVQLLKSGNDITQEMVTQELAAYDGGSGFQGYWRYMFMCGWPFPSRGDDAFNIFRDANVAMLTDGDLYQKPFIPIYYYRQFGGAVSMMDGAKASSAGPAPSSGPERVRKFFPETWLWDMVLIGPGGQSVQKLTVPDTITTWLTSAFSIHPQHGLSVIQQPAQLTTLKDVFVSLDLPYAAIRGEDLCMKAFAFNYHTETLSMTMVMAPTAEIANIRVRQGRESRGSQGVTRDLGRVRSNDVEEALFCFTPTGLGRFPLRVRLSNNDNRFSDIVERKLLVEPEGTPRVTNLPVILDLTPGQVFEHRVSILFPADTVQGSQRITVSAAGDLLGPVFANIDNLLRMPYGCGEQNMLYFAPNVFLIGYMQHTNTYTKQRAETAENYMIIGYQREIKYQHNDGSFSAFGNRKTEESGSMWLTAFVVKCFAQALALGPEVVTIEPSIMRKAVLWMASRQQKDGSFPEPGKVFNKNMQGGSAKGEALTAYVVIALAETKVNFKEAGATEPANGLKSALTDSLSRGKTYLEQQLGSLTDPYDIAIVTYALQLTNSSLADQAFQLLMSKAVRDPLTLHWERPKPPTETRYPWQRQTDAINIEMTSYALLTHLARNDVAGGLPIVRWMTSQRGPQGGFISTQDTVIGLQALALVAAEIYSPTFSPITVTVLWSAGGVGRSLQFKLDDATLLKKMPIPIENNAIPTEITIQASAPNLGDVSSFAVAEVTLNYNVADDPLSAPFSLSAQVVPLNDQQQDSFLLTVTASRVDGQLGSMTILDVAMLTGYDVDEDHPLYDNATAKTTERKDRQYIIYFDEMGRTEVTVRLPMVVTNGLPLRPQKAVIHVYDYYENDQQHSIKYDVKGKNVCSAQPSYEECRPYRQRISDLNLFLRN
ncbi:hypothetical protein ACOMHN_050345 [Nucella lapillus]